MVAAPSFLPGFRHQCHSEESRSREQNLEQTLFYPWTVEFRSQTAPGQQGAVQVCRRLTGTSWALVQVIIAAEWLLEVLFRDKRPCEFSPAEFAMLQLYVMVLMVGALVLALGFFCHVYVTYSYSHTGQTRLRAKLQAALLILTLLLSVCVWVTWIALLTYRNLLMARRPDWDDPVIRIALVTNGWVLMLGHDQPLKSSGIPEQKDYSIPRPTTTNINQPYDEYYEHKV
ncbi:G-protein coupled receptor family C group 5 member B [Triplophysa dalaica]|uniref:G-protein coupled receptor family C group 5 member B n=1 Tax=Triplophysa dalaica TaxID=1582913 RepID=UPI0024DFE0E6|nr:G-protein coupled receptor family C group 5 member B [Triplophysa dalaica]